MKSTKAAIASGLTLFMIAGHAVEPYAPIIPLWNENFQLTFAGFDVYASTPGIELLGATLGQEVVPASGGHVQSNTSIRIRVMDSATGTLIETFVADVPTTHYPDPSTSVTTTYYCYQGDFEYLVDPQTDAYPCDVDVSAGIANAGATSYVVIGLAVYSRYEDSIEGNADIGRAGIDVFNPNNGNRIWQRSFPVVDGNFELDPAICGVGDYLYGDGIDELRVGYARELNDGRVKMRYYYYQITNGQQIGDRIDFNVPSI